LSLGVLNFLDDLIMTGT